MALDPLDYRCNLALAMLEYNRADFPQAVAYATQALKRAHALNKKSAVRTGEFDSRQCLRTSGGNINKPKRISGGRSGAATVKAGGYYGLARLAARNGHFDAGLDFLPTKSSRLPNQSGSALPA
ncbi:hypothetical protein HTS61_18425 [Escherichia coli]|nr:hypothetical protein [Escherichia coli]